MRTALTFILVLGLCLFKRDNHSCFISAREIVRNGIAPGYPLKNIAGSNHKQSQAFYLAFTACSDDDDDEYEAAKKKASHNSSPYIHDLSREIIFIHDLKQSQQKPGKPVHLSRPNYIFQRELLI